jgi:hypothetical protein
MTSIGSSLSDVSDDSVGTRHCTRISTSTSQEIKLGLLLSIVKYQLLIMSISLDTLKGFKLDRVLSESELCANSLDLS